jgi:hypothetical protein
MSKFLKLIEEHDPATKRKMDISSKAKKSKFLEMKVFIKRRYCCQLNDRLLL